MNYCKNGNFCAFTCIAESLFFANNNIIYSIEIPCTAGQPTSGGINRRREGKKGKYIQQTNV